MTDASPPLSGAPAVSGRRWPWLPSLALYVLALAVVISLGMAWAAQKRVAKVEQELVRRQQESQAQSGEARLLAKQAQENAMESAAKVALLEVRLSEVAIQRTQLEELIQSLSRSRDENVVVDIEASLRVAQQQSSITGSAEPLVAALRQADERIARYGQPRLDGVRRALARDLDRVRAVGVPDIGALTIRVDEVVRLVDELPLLSQAESGREAGRPQGIAGTADAGTSIASETGWLRTLGRAWNDATVRIWDEVRSLVRVTRIDQPDAMLLAPDQAFFLRENIKLRLLNARLALLSRHFNAAQADLQSVLDLLDRYFDRHSRRTVIASDLVRQVSASARHVSLPRPDETLAALAAAAAGR